MKMAQIISILFGMAAGGAAGKKTAEKTVKKPTQNKAVNVYDTAYKIAYSDVKKHEGLRLDAYNDSLGILTVGYGHKVLPGDNLKLGSKITQKQADDFLAKDLQSAFKAAISQARELNKDNDAFLIAALTEVNYQLGIYWRSKFATTWLFIKKGDINKAITNIKNSAWKKQTPNRADNFIKALQKSYNV